MRQRISTNAKSKAYAIEVLGWEHTETVQVYNPHSHRSRDLYNIIDLLSLTGGRLVGIQACGGSDAKKHREKLGDDPRTFLWLKAGLDLELWVWRKVKLKRGGKKMIWAVKRQRASPPKKVGGEIEWVEIR